MLPKIEQASRDYLQSGNRATYLPFRKRELSTETNSATQGSDSRLHSSLL